MAFARQSLMGTMAWPQWEKWGRARRGGDSYRKQPWTNKAIRDETHSYVEGKEPRKRTRLKMQEIGEG